MRRPTPAQPSFLHRFVSGEVQFGFWQLIAKGIGFANTFLVLGSLTLYQYGVFQLLLSAYALFSEANSIGGGVVANDLSRYVGEKKESAAKRLFFQYEGIRLTVGVLLFLLFFFGSSLLSFKYKPDFIDLLQLIGFLFLSETLFTSSKSLLRLRLRFSVLASRTALYKFIQLGILLFFLVFFTIDLRAVVLSLILASALSLITLLPAAHDAYKPWRGVVMMRESLLFSIMLTYGKWNLMSQFFSKAVSGISPWIIKVLISTEAVAIFSVANMLVGGLRDLFPTKTLGTLIPMRIADTHNAQKIFTFGTKYLFVLGVGITVLASVAITPVFQVFFPHYAAALPLFYAMVGIVPISALSTMITLFTIALRKQKFLFYQSMIKNVTMLGGYLAFIPLFGLWGMVCERIVTSVYMFLSSYLYIRKMKPGIHFSWRSLASFGPEDAALLKQMLSLSLSGVRRKWSKLLP